MTGRSPASQGPGFFALHTSFQTQYEELFIAIDEIAERVRALDAYAIGGAGRVRADGREGLVTARNLLFG